MGVVQGELIRMGVVQGELIKDFSFVDKADDAGMAYADQIEAVYQLFAENVSEGIKKRKDSTQIYAYAMQIIVEATDDEIVDGLSIDVTSKGLTRDSREYKREICAPSFENSGRFRLMTEEKASC